MSDRPDVPDFARLLAPHLAAVPEEARAAFLCGLERSAAARYREWAVALPDHASVLQACAAREEEIAELAGGLFPLSSEGREAVEAALPRAVATYYEIFAPHSLLDQLYLQSEAELQGAQAWAGIVTEAGEEGTKEILARCTALEQESSRAVKELIAKIG